MADPAEFTPNFIWLDFADGEYLFRLPIGMIAELQTKCDAGVGLIFQRLMKGRYPDDGQVIFNPLEAIFKYQDITETIRLGLIGGGEALVDGKKVKVSPADAIRLIRTYVEPRPLLENWSIAAAIAIACMVGYHDPKTEKKSPAPESQQEPASEGVAAKDGSPTTSP